MSSERREQLVEDVVNTQPELRAFIRNVAPLHDLVSVSWDGLSYSFQRGFETLWDQAQRDGSGLLLRPLLLLWRQSVELALKASIRAIAGEFKSSRGHDLKGLFDELLRARAENGYVDDDDLTNGVRETITFVQALDPFADRFRYPSSRGGKWFDGIAADLDALFQAHWIIITYCEGAAMEVEEGRQMP